MNSEQKLLTISIAAYNVEKYIGELLDCIIKCKYLDKVEVLIIDDGGTDNTVTIASEYVNRFPNSIKIIHKENGGWGSTVNTGIDNASGKYFKLLDGDDYFDSIALDKFIVEIENVDTDIIATGYRTFNDLDNETLSIFENPTKVIEGKVYNIDDIIEIYNPMMHSITVKTNVLRDGNVRILEHCFYTDAEYVLRTIKNVSTIVFINVILYQYRMSRGGQSVSPDGLRKHYADHLRVCEEMLRMDRQLDFNGNVRIFIHRRVLNLIEAQYVIFMLIGFDGDIKEAYRNFDDSMKHNYQKLYNECAISIKGLRIATKLGLWNQYAYVYKRLTGRKEL